LQSGQPQWNQGKKQIHAYYSEIDGSVQPYGVTLPANYDPAKPAGLYVWLHGRQNNTTEAEFIFNFFEPQAAGERAGVRSGPDSTRLLCRINSAGWHWAGEADIFEAIAAVKKRFNIDDKRVMLRGFSMGGEGRVAYCAPPFPTASRQPKSAPGQYRAGRNRKNGGRISARL